MYRAGVVVLAMVTFTISAAAQRPGAPAFEVASIKPNTSGAPGSSGRTGNGSVIFANQTVRSLISNAFDLRGNRIVGGPPWLDSERFDINARAPENTPDAALPPMMQTLLAERFKLIVKREVRDEPVYALVVARDDKRLGPNLRPSTDCIKAAAATGRAGGGPGGPLLQPGRPAPCGSRMLGDSRGITIQSGMRTMADLAGMLRGVGEREVVDRTGLSGTFDFELRYASDSIRTTVVDPTQVLPDVFTALQEQLGLKLESQRGPVEYLVIERIERPTLRAWPDWLRSPTQPR
jgi:uncharacterized protein (TIGR03435 family)